MKEAGTSICNKFYTNHTSRALKIYLSQPDMELRASTLVGLRMPCPVATRTTSLYKPPDTAWLAIHHREHQSQLEPSLCSETLLSITGTTTTWRPLPEQTHLPMELTTQLTSPLDGFPTGSTSLISSLGSESTLPYLSPNLTGQKLLVGANFASAGIGILNDTGIQFLNIIRMLRQLEYFQEYQQKVSAMIGAENTKKLVSEALVLITVGGNDFVNNYFLVPFSARSRQYSLPDYVVFLISEYKKLLMRLYDLGARRVLVTGTGPMGCVPAEIGLRSPNGECAPELQQAAALYNPQLVQVITELNNKYGSDVFVSVNIFQAHNDFISNPQLYGFLTSKIACCGQGPYNGIGLCTVASNLCPNRDKYAFWDPFHPSQQANRLIVQQIMTGSVKYMSPMNLSTILALDSKN